MTLKATLTAFLATTGLAAAGLAPAAHADCIQIRFSDGTQPETVASTALARVVLDGLGYKVTVSGAPAGDTLQALAAGQLDVFLGLWLPSMQADFAPYKTAGTVAELGTNLSGARQNLAANDPASSAGIKEFAEIANFEDELDRTIHVPEGSPLIPVLQRLIRENIYGLDDFHLSIDSPASLAKVLAVAAQDSKPLVYVATQPDSTGTAPAEGGSGGTHFLTGGDAVFGAEDGNATVRTLARSDFAGECTNAAKFLKNLKFTLPMEEQVMASVRDDGLVPQQAATDWLKAHPDVLSMWLTGVTTADGKDADKAVRDYLSQ